MKPAGCTPRRCSARTALCCSFVKMSAAQRCRQGDRRGAAAKDVTAVVARVSIVVAVELDRRIGAKVQDDPGGFLAGREL